MVSISDKEDLESKLREAGDKLVVIDFYASWCGPCRIMLPKFEELAKDFPDVVLLKVDVDECEEITQEYNIAAMPTFVYIRKNVVITSFSGANPDRLKKVTEQQVKNL